MSGRASFDESGGLQRLFQGLGNLQSAFELRLQGTRDETLLARLLDVKASLYADRREFTAAHECLDQVLRICRRLRLHQLSVKILIQKGSFDGSAGELREAIGCLERAIARMDPARNADLVLSVRFNLASWRSQAHPPSPAKIAARLDDSRE